MAAASIIVAETPLVRYLLRRADDALILGHRLSEWCGKAPMMEEEMALANMGLDLIGQGARGLNLCWRGGGSRRARRGCYAYLRDVRGYGNLCRGAAQWRFRRDHVCASSSIPLHRSLLARPSWRPADATLAAIAPRRERKRKALSCAPFREWVIRLGDGTAESLARQDALDNALGLHRRDVRDRCGEQSLIRGGPRARPGGAARPLAGERGPRWVAKRKPASNCPRAAWMQKGGRSGQHSEHLGHLLSDLPI